MALSVQVLQSMASSFVLFVD